MKFDHQFPLRPDALTEARERFARWATDTSFDVETVGDLAIVVSELGANAIDAAASSSAVGVIRAWRDDEGIVVEVSNAPSDRVESVIIHQTGDTLRGRGRGLGIVAAFTDSIEIVAPGRGAGLTVRCRKLLAGDGERPLGTVAS